MYTLMYVTQEQVQNTHSDGKSMFRSNIVTMVTCSHLVPV